MVAISGPACVYISQSVGYGVIFYMYTYSFYAVFRTQYILNNAQKRRGVYKVPGAPPLTTTQPLCVTSEHPFTPPCDPYARPARSPLVRGRRRTIYSSRSSNIPPSSFHLYSHRDRSVIIYLFLPSSTPSPLPVQCNNIMRAHEPQPPTVLVVCTIYSAIHFNT